MQDWSPVIERIRETTGQPFALAQVRPAGGGCIHQSVILEGGDRRYFAKRNDPGRLDLFVAEAEGLRALRQAAAVRVPEPVCWGADADSAWLVLEYLELAAPGARAQAALGRRLAGLHRTTATRFGWHRDNAIGLTPQPNGWSEDWSTFFRERRLGFQLELALRDGHRRLAAAGERLLARVDGLLRGGGTEPSLLHGDLWSGNVGQTAAHEPVLFDPAVYFGDREADLAMTELFGGFADGFYGAYRDAWPLAPGYETRRTLYNLYHVLNHLNLFGAGYLGQAERMIGQLLAEAG